MAIPENLSQVPSPGWRSHSHLLGFHTTPLGLLDEFSLCGIQENLSSGCFHADKNECNTEGQRDVDKQTLQDFFPVVGLALVLFYVTLGTSSSAEKELFIMSFLPGSEDQQSACAGREGNNSAASVLGCDS